MRVLPFLEAIIEPLVEEIAGGPSPALLRRTQDAKFGDYQSNAAMPLGKRLGKSPREVGEQIAQRLAEHSAVAKTEVAGPGFVNIWLDDVWLANILEQQLIDVRQGVTESKPKSKVVVDYSGPNIAKQMHVGHLRSTIIGDSIVRTLRFLGHEVIGDIHLGDWGTQFGLLIVGMREWGDEQAFAEDAIVELERIYKLASERASQDEAFKESARAELAKLQHGDSDNTALWKRFVAATRESLDKCYDLLEITFDEWLGESAYNDMLPGVAKQVQDAGLAREDNGALCVFFGELEQAPKALRKQKEPYIIRKRDGAFLYSTTDLATILYRVKNFANDRAVYVVDQRQALHFKQLFALAQMLGIDMKLEHVGFGTVLGSDGKPLKTREGSDKKVTLFELLTEAVERSKAQIQETGLEVPEDQLEHAARTIGIGAVKYADLRNNRLSDYQFDWDKMISFKGNAGPYIQYAYARIQSIFRKGAIDKPNAPVSMVLASDAEKELARELLRFDDVVHSAAESFEPHQITDHLYALARAFSSFYENCPILKSEGDERSSRIALAALTAAQLKRGLSLLGIGVLERM